MAQRHVALTLNSDGSSVAVVILAPGALRDPAPSSPVPAGMLDVRAVEIFPTAKEFRSAAVWIDKRFADERGLTGPDWSIAVETSHYIQGRPFADALTAYARRAWPFLAVRRIEMVSTDIPRPVRDGWRVKVGRRDVMSALMHHIGKGLLFVPASTNHVADLRRQLDTVRTRRPGEAEVPEELACALGLAVWTATRGAVTLGGFVGMKRGAA